MSDWLAAVAGIPLAAAVLIGALGSARRAELRSWLADELVALAFRVLPARDADGKGLVAEIMRRRLAHLAARRGEER